jgi:hypothetical protein
MRRNFFVFVLVIFAGIVPSTYSFGKVSDADIDKMAQNGDFKGLHDLCYKGYGSSGKACEMLPLAAAVAITKSPCDQVLKKYDYYTGKFGFKMASPPKMFYITMAARMAKCNLWDAIFEKIVPLGESEHGTGLVVLAKLSVNKNKKFKPLKHFMEYLKRHSDHPFDFFNAQNAANHIVDWLYLMKVKCKPFLKYIARMPDGPYKAFDWWIRETKCKSARPMVLKRLSSRNPDIRRRSCLTLGEIGTKRDIKKLKILAQSDPAFRVKGLVKDYYVRDACQQAINRIRLR